MQNTTLQKATARSYTNLIFTALYKQVTRHIKISHLIIFLFAYTATSKLTAVTAFKEAMFKSPVLHSYINVLAYAIPISEIIVCFLLLFNKTKKAGYYFSLFLFIAFTGYIIYILKAYPHNLPCVCGGVISLMSWKQHLLFNFFFIAITARAIYLSRGQQTKKVQAAYKN